MVNKSFVHDLFVTVLTQPTNSAYNKVIRIVTYFSNNIFDGMQSLGKLLRSVSY